MSQTIPSTEPRSVTAGDTLKWTKTLADYPASAWTLSYRLINAAAAIDISASADGDTHSISVAAATTAAWADGDYAWISSVTDGTERYTLDRGEITVLPNLAAASATDTRTQAQKAIADLKAAIATYTATNGHVHQYSIAGRTMQFRSVADMQQLLQFWKKQRQEEITAERLAAGLDPYNKILVRL